MKLQDIFVYPIKSLGGFRTSSWQALERGFQFDRRWMLVDVSGRFITQRVDHKLALLKAEFQSDYLVISHKHFPDTTITLEVSSNTSSEMTASIWDDTITAVHINKEADKWFSSYLGKECKLVFMPESGIRPVDERFAENGEQVSFADAFPYLLIGQSSLDDLNSRLASPVPMNRFRPNLVVSGSAAFEEDSWAEIKIGEVRFKIAKPCARCILTTVNQETGEKGKEPLATLAKYRMVGNKVVFGQNLLALNEGVIRIDDAVEVVRFKSLRD